NDQVKMLQELSSIVSRTGGTLDIAPAQAPAPAPAPRQPLADLRPAVSDTPAPVLPPLPARPTAARSERPAAPRPATAKPAGQKGWLSDLLQRASEEDKTPAPAETADPLTLDIARMVDPEVLEDAWDRFSRGEATAFTMRLYTAQGRQTFEEIRRKYRRDQEFHDTVDRYIAEFERLLEDTGDRNGKTARSYLSSDSGRVYTMLSHASGRVE
ncbi:MAG: antitoxin, partial [Proteobacteria bacterium]|nr:antitoxin [Pseudomonadota bacterium]